MPEYYERWTVEELNRLTRLTSGEIVQIFNDCGSFTSRFIISRHRFEHFYVCNGKLTAVYNATVKDDVNNEWITCEIFINKTTDTRVRGGFIADFGGAPIYDSIGNEK
jgi:hypothetical protein